MKKLGVLLFLLGTAIPCFSDFSSKLNIETEDGTVNTYPYQARFQNGSLTDNNDGTVSIKGSILNQTTPQADSSFNVSSGTIRNRLSGPSFNSTTTSTTVTGTLNISGSGTSAQGIGYLNSNKQFVADGTFGPNYLKTTSLGTRGIDLPAASSVYSGFSTNANPPVDSTFTAIIGNSVGSNQPLLQKGVEITLSGAGNKNIGGDFYVDGGTTNIGVLISVGATGASPASANVNNIALEVLGGQTILFGSMTVLSSSGAWVDYGLRSGSITVSNLTAGRCVETTTGGLLTVAGAPCGSGGGGGSSTLEVVAGLRITSPTATINLYSGDFLGSATGTTAQIYLNPATTDYIHNQTTAQTATFNTSSGTATAFNTNAIQFQVNGNLIKYKDGTVIFSQPEVQSLFTGYNTNLINLGGVFNTSYGTTAMPYPGSGNFNTCIGNSCMAGNVITTAENNNAMGYASCGALRAGFYNNCMGGSSGNQLRDGNYNTLVGAYSGTLLTDENGTTQVGYEAGRYQLTGPFVTSVGFQAGNGTTTLNANTTGSGDTYIGKGTGQDIPSATAINNSFAIGINALVHASNEGQLGGRNGSGYETLTRTSSMTVESPFMQVAGKNVCLADGTNCVVTASSSTFGSTSTSYGNIPWVTMTSSGSSQGLLVKSYGAPSGGYQNQIGAVTIVSTTSQLQDMGVPAPLLVIVDSTTDSQVGTGLLEIWENNPLHNDPLIWIHNTANTSNPWLRVDDPAPDIEIVNTSTDNAHGYGKWEIASAFQAKTLQINNRAYDNSTFENLLEINPLSAASNDANGAPGIYLKAQTLANDSGVLTSSDTAQIRFIGQNGSSVGLTGPLNPVGGSYAFGLPIIPKSAGQLLYFQANRGNNFSVRQTTWTDTDFTYSPTTGVTVSSVTASGVLGLPKMTKAVIGARSPGAVAELVYCTDCALTFTCVSTGTAAGQYAAEQASGKTTACN